jgi:cytoskeletal protein CcmA (bactofilin family)
MGAVTGTITATEKIDIRDNGSVDGEMLSPRIRIAEGALFHGFVEMPKPRRAAAAALDLPTASVWLAPEKDREKSAAEKKPDKKTAGQAAAMR